MKPRMGAPKTAPQNKRLEYAERADVPRDAFVMVNFTPSEKRALKRYAGKFPVGRLVREIVLKKVFKR